MVIVGWAKYTRLREKFRGDTTLPSRRVSSHCTGLCIIAIAKIRDYSQSKEKGFQLVQDSGR